MVERGSDAGGVGEGPGTGTPGPGGGRTSYGSDRATGTPGRLDYGRSPGFWQSRSAIDQQNRSVVLSDEVPPCVTEWLTRRIVSRRIRSLARRGPFDRLLDIGRGVGNWTVALAGLRREAVAVDFCEEFVRATRKRALEAGIAGLDVRRLDWRCEGVEGTFDLVTMGAVTMYVADEDMEALAARLRGLARPGGILYLRSTTHRGATLYNVLGDYQAIYRPEDYYPGLLEAHGFRALEARRVAENSYQGLIESYLALGRALLPARWAPTAERGAFAAARATWPLSLWLALRLKRPFRPPRLESWEYVFERCAGGISAAETPGRSPRSPEPGRA